MKKQNKSLIAILALTGFMLILFTGCKKEDPVELPAVNTIIISNITQTSAHSGGNITSDGGADINLRGLVWSNSANPSIENHTGMSLEGAGIGIFVSMMTALEPETTYYGKDEFGLSALPGGNRSTSGSYNSLGIHGSWWSSTEYSTTTAWSRGLYGNSGIVLRYGLSKGNGFSVRCVRDN